MVELVGRRILELVGRDGKVSRRTLELVGIQKTVELVGGR